VKTAGVNVDESVDESPPNRVTQPTVTTAQKTIGKSNIRHGLRASGLPSGCSYLEGQLREFRRYLHAELAERGIEGTYPEALTQSAVRHETRALLASRWLRREGEALPLQERLSILATISAATDARDRCLEKLGIDRPPGPAQWPTITINATPSPVRPAVASEAETASEAAPAAASCDAARGEPESESTATPESEPTP
jgi:hypothetical protein